MMISYLSPRYFHSLLEQNRKQLYFIRSFSPFMEEGNLRSIDLGESMTLLYWRDSHLESTPNSTGQGALHWGVHWQRKPSYSPGKPGQHSGIYKKDNNQSHGNQNTIQSVSYEQKSRSSLCLT